MSLRHLAQLPVTVYTAYIGQLEGKSPASKHSCLSPLVCLNCSYIWAINGRFPIHVIKTTMHSRLFVVVTFPCRGLQRRNRFKKRPTFLLLRVFCDCNVTQCRGLERDYTLAGHYPRLCIWCDVVRHLTQHSYKQVSAPPVTMARRHFRDARPMRTTSLSLSLATVRIERGYAMPRRLDN